MKALHGGIVYIPYILLCGLNVSREQCYRCDTVVTIQ